MSGSEKSTSSSGSDPIAVLTIVLSFIFLGFAKGFYYGAFRRKTWSRRFITGWLAYSLAATAFVMAPGWNFLDVMSLRAPHLAGWVHWHVSLAWQAVLLVGAPLVSTLVVIGLIDWLARRRLQTQVQHLGLKTPTGLEPSVVRVIELPNYQRKLLVKAVGIDVADFRSRKGALESSFNALVQDIRVCESNKQMVEILLSDKELPKLVPFEEAMAKATKPYSFPVGLSFDGFVTADLKEIHHLLIAGATGNGKSSFFKQAVVGLLRSSEMLQLYLIDLKRGVETKAFQPLNNVRVVKESVDAIACLKVVVEEMDRRYRFLESKSHNEINSARDRLDRIVVAIDEASVLFTVERSSPASKANAQMARDLTDKIAKLGRAAGIHLILATQKVVKETIDTRVQTNINARICFRVNELQASMTVLGNKSAVDLPEIKGRGIWSVGSQNLIVQAPKLSNEELADQVEGLLEKFNGDVSPLKQKMIYDPDTSESVDPFEAASSTFDDTKVSEVV
jgi:DNA segregation ATPase FtsK/SpoIIIE-like protein